MANPTALFQTSLGNFTVEVLLDQMPITAQMTMAGKWS